MTEKGSSWTFEMEPVGVWTQQREKK